MKKRNLEYERKFRAYLFSFDFKTHLEICKNINATVIEKEDEDENTQNKI